MDLPQENDKEIEGGSPSRPVRDDESKHDDDASKPSKQIKKEAIQQSESENMTGKQGYNETPPTAPVESTHD